MNDGADDGRRRRTRRALVATAALFIVTSCGGGDDRPAVDAWRAEWESRQALMPSADEILAGGADLCGERLGLFRTEMQSLRPAPFEELDAAVDDWVAHAETIVFECPTDSADLADRLETLDVLAAEVDAGLAAEHDR